MTWQLPMIDVSARWTGTLACLDDAACERAGDGWPAVVAAYVQSGTCEHLSAGGCSVTLRPLSAAEEDAAESEAGPAVALAGFIYRRLQASGLDLSDSEAVSRAVEALPDGDRLALHRHEMRTQRLRTARVSRALVAADFASPGEAPADALARVAEPMRGHVIIELAAHLDRIGTLSHEGKAHAGEP